MSHNPFAIETFKLTKWFDSLVAVDGIDLQIGKGELFALLGPNGAGKTTTINMLCCLLSPTSGTASVLGYDIVKEPHEIKSRIGVSPQENALSERLNSWENLSLIGKIHGLSRRALEERSQRLLETVGLVDRARDPVGKFSGGMKRRLNMIMALVHDPELLFLDEPSLGLDPQARRVVWDYIAELKGKKTILLTTHYMEEADALADRIGIIDEGHIVALGTSAELKRSYSDTRTMTISAGNITGDILTELGARYLRVEEADDKLKIWGRDLVFREIVDYLHSRGVIVYSAALEQPTLEDVFLGITGKALRE